MRSIKKHMKNKFVFFINSENMVLSKKFRDYRKIWLINKAQTYK